MKAFILYLWQLPQNLLGLLLIILYRAEPFFIYHGRTEYKVWRSKRMRGGISLGKYILLGREVRRLDVLHEHGHQVQSLWLGPLYLLIVGLWSVLRAGLNLYAPGHYYDAFPEDWADRLGGVKKDMNGRRYVPSAKR